MWVEGFPNWQNIEDKFFWLSLIKLLNKHIHLILCVSFERNLADPQVQAMVVVEKDKDIFFTELRKKLSWDTETLASILWYLDSALHLDDWLYVWPVVTTSNLHHSKIFTKLFRKHETLYLKAQLNVKWASRPYWLGLRPRPPNRNKRQLRVTNNYKYQNVKSIHFIFDRIEFRSISIITKFSLYFGTCLRLLTGIFIY